MPKNKEKIAEVRKNFIIANDPNIPLLKDMHPDFRNKKHWGGVTKQGYIYYDTPIGRESLKIG